jgi:hypothetical protein
VTSTNSTVSYQNNGTTENEMTTRVGAMTLRIVMGVNLPRELNAMTMDEMLILMTSEENLNKG